MNQQTNTTADRNLITSKELGYIEDYLSWELLAMKKCNHAVQSCTDPDIQNLIKQIGNVHVQHYNALVNYLQ